MTFNTIREAAKRPEILAMLAGAFTPATIIVSAVGLSAIIVFKGFKDLKDENKQLQKDKATLTTELEEQYYEAEYEEIDEYEEDEPYEQLDQPLLTASEPLNSTVQATVEKPLYSTADNGSNTVENMDDEALKKEMIRQTMSELGKRSAAARRAKKEHNT
jgi:hypothetical protein